LVFCMIYDRKNTVMTCQFHYICLFPWDSTLQLILQHTL